MPQRWRVGLASVPMVGRVRRSLDLEPLQRLVDAVVLVLGVAVLVLVVVVVAAGGLLVTGRGCVSKVAGAQVHPAKQAAAAIQAVRHVAPGQGQRQGQGQRCRRSTIWRRQGSGGGSSHPKASAAQRLGRRQLRRRTSR